MSAHFPGFPQEAIQFFRSLARNNKREWFQPRKPVFDEKVKQPMVELVHAVNTSLKRFAPDYVSDPQKAIYRIYRDTRFSADKTPYKLHIAASFRHRKLGDGGAGFYCAISHKSVDVGGGMYMITPETLLAVRNRIAEHTEEFRKLIRAAAVRRLLGDLQGEQLSRTPKGFCTDHPAADLLKFKQLYFYTELDPALATTPKLEDEIIQRFRAMKPFLDFLNAAAAPPKPL